MFKAYKNPFHPGKRSPFYSRKEFCLSELVIKAERISTQIKFRFYIKRLIWRLVNDVIILKQLNYSSISMAGMSAFTSILSAHFLWLFFGSNSLSIVADD